MTEATKETPFKQESGAETVEATPAVGSTERFRRPNLLRNMSFEWFGFSKTKKPKVETPRDDATEPVTDNQIIVPQTPPQKIKDEGEGLEVTMNIVAEGDNTIAEELAERTEERVEPEVAGASSHEEPKIQGDSHLIKKLAVSFAFLAVAAGFICKAITMSSNAASSSA